MAAGRAVVATDIGGTRELVLGGETGILVPPEDPEALARAIGDVLGDPGLMERLASAGQRRAFDHFSAGAMVDAVAREYDRVLAGD